MKYFDGGPIRNLRLILNHIASGVDFRLQDDSDGFGPFPTRNLDAMPTESEIRAAEQDALAAKEKDDLARYAEEVTLRRGALIRDPDTDTAVVDPDADLETLRRETNRLRVKVIERDKRGSGAANQRARASRVAEENLSIALYDVSVGIAGGAVTTRAQIDTAIGAVAIP